MLADASRARNSSEAKFTSCITTGTPRALRCHPTAVRRADFPPTLTASGVSGAGAGWMSRSTANSRGMLHTVRLLMASRPRAAVLQLAHTATALRRLSRKLGVYDTPPEGCSASMNR